MGCWEGGGGRAKKAWVVAGKGGGGGGGKGAGGGHGKLGRGTGMGVMPATSQNVPNPSPTPCLLSSCPPVCQTKNKVPVKQGGRLLGQAGWGGREGGEEGEVKVQTHAPPAQQARRTCGMQVAKMGRAH